MYYILAILAAFLLSAFQYLYKRKALSLFILRFLTYLVIALLLINPQLIKKQTVTTKPQLYVLADNSASIKKQKTDNNLQKALKKLQNSNLSDQFSIQYFSFSQDLKSLDSLNFSGQQTNISKALNELQNLSFSEQPAPVILLTDGQQNIGKDYRFFRAKNFHIYPVVFGDTVKREDIRIDLVNANSYAYKGNQFPVEIFISGNIRNSVKSHLQIKEGKQVLFQQTIQLNPDKNQEHLEILLPAKTVGNHYYTVYLQALPNEKMLMNNKAYFNVEVIDNAKKILLISDIIHPDLGAIKRSLSSHKYLQVDLVQIKQKVPALKDYQAFVLYQPNAKFGTIFKQLNQKQLPWWIVTGKQTDWRYLNAQNLFFNRDFSHSTEAYFPVKNENFSLFKLPDLSFEKLPPLTDAYGKISLQEATDIALYSKINGITTQEPLLAINNTAKQAVLFGENIWQWAMQSRLNGQNEEFDLLLYQIVQYLSLQERFDRLKLTYKRHYFKGEPIKITAQFLNENLEFDNKANPVVQVQNQDKWETVPMSLQSDFYQADLSFLTSGKHNFVVRNSDGSLQKKGSFLISNFGLEDKNLYADIPKLETLAQENNGKLYFSHQILDLIDAFQQPNKYPAQISYREIKSSLIDYKWLLGLLVLLLSVEWLLKKLRGSL